MLTTSSTSKKPVRWKAKKQQETAMRALRHQINPHFLYNTLESIRARALVLKDRETAEAIEGLGRLYRTLIRCPEVIPLQKEVEIGRAHV